RRAEHDRRFTLHAALAVVVLALDFPVGAWAAGGMETGVATALCTLAAVCFKTPGWCALLAGVAAGLRPELVVGGGPLACGSAHSFGPRSAPPPVRVARGVALACTPFLLCVVVRIVVFGRPAPLAVLAKPSDLSHGLTYAAAASLFVLTPLLTVAPLALRRA